VAKPHEPQARLHRLQHPIRANLSEPLTLPTPRPPVTRPPLHQERTHHRRQRHPLPHLRTRATPRRLICRRPPHTTLPRRQRRARQPRGCTSELQRKTRQSDENEARPMTRGVAQATPTPPATRVSFREKNSAVTGRGAIQARETEPMTPEVSISLPEGENVVSSDVTVDFDARLAEARRTRRCAECGDVLDHRSVPRSAFCSAKHRYAFRDRRRYVDNPERERERSRAYYAVNRELVLEKAAVKRGRSRTIARATCEECGEPLPDGRRVVCSRRCVDARSRRKNPAAYAEREARRVVRRREARRVARIAGGES
jgi:hypothetical protein